MKSIYFSVLLIGTLSLITGCEDKENETLPVLTTETVTVITAASATSGGNISSDGNASITERGVCWSTSNDPTITDSKTSDGTGTGQFISNLTGLTSNTLYYVRAYATNSAGTAYGNVVSFTTSDDSQALELTTSPITLIAATTATSGGNITDDGGSDISVRGVSWSTSPTPTITGSHTTDGSGTGAFTSNITGLTASTMYYVRAYATNSSGTAYGNEVTFTTTSEQGTSEVDINIAARAFSPRTITVPVNTTVTWTNNDGMAHTVTSDTGLFDSGTFGAGGTYSYQFTTAGTYNYHCTLHADMTATVIVQ
jgi:plastocyanin